MYKEDLLKLSRGIRRTPAGIAPNLSPISTPLNITQWRVRLQHHPDHEFSQWLLNGLREGFPLGIQEGSQLRPAVSNMQSARDNLRMTIFRQRQPRDASSAHTTPTACQAFIQTALG